MLCCFLTTHLRLLAWVLAFVLLFSPLSALASTPIDSEIRDDTQWYAFAAYSEIYEVAPPPHLVSLAAQVIEEENWPADTQAYYHLVNYLLAFEQVDASASLDEIKAVYLGLFDTLTNPQYITIVTNGGWNEKESIIDDRQKMMPRQWSYDQVGNITQIMDASQTNAGKTITYTYDDLHRLLTSSITGAANGDNVGRTYTYSAIGNILTASDQGTYLYENTNYANPHAVTKVGSAVYAYDNNGNLIGDTVWTHTWDYNNKLTQSQKTGSTVTYQYDHSGQRTKYANGIKTIRYANKLYNSDGTTPTKHIYAGSQLIGTVEGSTLQYVHTDHLTGSNVATNSSGTMIQLLDYQPYGALRIDWKSGTFDEQRKFTGHEFDRLTSLTYANARYYKQNVGRFLSQDSAFLAVGAPGLKQITGLELQRYLESPQSMNAYSYAADNPLKYVDHSGEFIGEPGRALAGGQRQVAQFLHQAANYTSSQGGLINRISGFVTNAVADTVSNVANVFDPDQGAGTRLLGLGLTAFDVASGGEGKATRSMVGQSFGALVA
ncbi:hypothetical protein A2693_04255 [Candidatus Curtissbacteria bacterium RIFCSPHIGHO2_01_FULL_40_12]|uniref:Uncharacterized protein n=1 Tax=Candidatus Curtissbacteria bacterium RIFCSPHIGHO2_01_FULL_40_12 TaxID=1797710 RepID=A0A1F5G9A9_9BACT|nr:MAG: hypothetical protein A2693_04255 [Candidatus Curtissbacteria bacterium RIFCSPHIGHO2_01_FULL_40_12]